VSTPKVSVILTSFNHDKYLSEAIDSVLNQTFTDFELIIWDDASSDNSWEIICSYNDLRIKTYRNEQNLRSNINRALKIASGEYIAIHHSDDVWELDKLAKQVDFLDANQNIGAVFTNAQPVDQRAVPLTDETHFYYNIFNQPNRSRYEWLNYFFLTGNALCHPSLLIRKQCYTECGTYRDMFAQLPDFDMWVRLCVKYEIHVMEDRLVKFRILDDGMNTSGNRPATRIRSANEYYQLLQQYRTIAGKENIFKLFPDFIAYDRGDNTDAEYVLARVCLQFDDSFLMPFLKQLLAIEILFDILNNPARRQAVEKHYGFTANDFVAITGQCDLFSRQELFNLQAAVSDADWQINNLTQTLVGRNEQIANITQAVIERDGQIANITQAIANITQAVVERDGHINHLNHVVEERSKAIQVIENSLSWRITRPLRNALGSTTPLGIASRRAAKLAWWTVTLQLPKKLRERRMSMNADGINQPHFSYPSDHCSFSVPFDYSIEKPPTTPSVAVVCHLYYPELLEEFKSYLLHIPFSFDLFITTDTEEKKDEIASGLLGWSKGAVEIRLAPNRGRDIAPKLISCRDVYDRYEFFLHIHSKKSPQLDVLAGWRDYLLGTLLGSEDIVASIFEAFNSDPKLGMVAPEHFVPVRGYIGWGWNFEIAKKFASQLGIKLSINGKIDFPSGSMFWGRSAAIKPLLDANLTIEDFPPEDNQIDGTLGHIIERLYFFVCEKAGYRWAKIARPSLLKNVERVILVESKAALTDFIKSTQYELLVSSKQKSSRLSKLENSISSYYTGAMVHSWRAAHAKSDLRTLAFPEFCRELEKHIARQDSKIDFDEDFYLAAYPDIANEVAKGAVSCGYIHYCLIGQYEGRYRDHAGEMVHRWGAAHAKSDLRTLAFPEFCREIEKHIARQDSKIDFDEDFYLAAYPDIANQVAKGAVSCGYIHYCLIGQYEGRIYSDLQLKRRFSINPHYPDGSMDSAGEPPPHQPTLPKEISLTRLPQSPRPIMVVLFSHLQEDLFFAGYSEFFKDYAPVFELFDRVIIMVAHREFDRNIVLRYSNRIEVMHLSEMDNLPYKPDVIVGFNAHLTCMGYEFLPDNPERVVYYCQEFESGFFPYGFHYIIGEKAIAKSHNLIISTELLRQFLVKRSLVNAKQVFVTRPKIEPFHVPEAKTKRLFFYYRPESFHKRNLPETLMQAVVEFCYKHSGFEIYMLGSVATSYSFKINGTQIYVVNKLPKQDYVDLISSCDVVVSMIYAAHPGVIAFQSAASGIPTVTNIFENRDAALLKKISNNMVPYNPVLDSLLSAIEEALTMPKGQPSFQEELYSGNQQRSLVDFHKNILMEARR
jgi:glycosyltransferase involved in cell wall biosynthesis